VIGIFKVPVESNPVGYFKDTHRDQPALSRHLPGSFRVFPHQCHLESAGKRIFSKMASTSPTWPKCQQFLETLPGVDKTISFADYLKLVNYASNQFEAEYYVLPQEDFEVRMLINSYRTMLGEDMLTPLHEPGILQLSQHPPADPYFKLGGNFWSPGEDTGICANTLQGI
jgi:hypothetical protein